MTRFVFNMIPMFLKISQPYKISLVYMYFNVNHEIIIKCCALCKIARNMYDEIYNSV